MSGHDGWVKAFRPTSFPNRTRVLTGFLPPGQRGQFCPVRSR